MKKINIFILSILTLLVFSCKSNGQSDDKLRTDSRDTTVKEVSLLFLGDIMQHDLQIQSAYVPETGKYDFSSQFKYVKPIFDTTDIVVGNLEVTLGGPPYKGYPRFSSPDALAYAIKDAGIKYLGTANNHMYDKGKTGFERTLKMLDSIGLKRTGCFLNEADKKKHHPMVIEEKGFRIALFNYTYGLNGFVPQAPNIVNRLKVAEIKADLIKAKRDDFDALIVFFHWGKEYERHPNTEQITLANTCFENGADVVIGSHPHVIQRMEHKTYTSGSGKEKDVLVAYSLGNFVSNYGTWRYCDGGTMIRFKLQTDENETLKIVDPHYHLIWVYREPRGSKLKNYYVLPISEFEEDNEMKQADIDQMNIFIKDSRTLYNAENVHVTEYK